VAILEEVVADFFVCQRLERFCDIYPVVVDGLYCDVLLRVLVGLVGVQGKRKPSVVLLDGLFVCALLDWLACVPGDQPLERRRTLETPNTSYGSQMSGVVRAVIRIR
jgi:hypothetical protein